MGESLGVALVTGAASGIGRQLVIDLARRGRKAAGLDRDPEGLAGLEGDLAREAGFRLGNGRRHRRGVPQRRRGKDRRPPRPH